MKSSRSGSISCLFLIVTILAISCGDDDIVNPPPVQPDLHTLGQVRTNWTLSSMPAIDTNSVPYQRGKIMWHNLPAISREEVFEEDARAAQGAIRPLRLAFLPGAIDGSVSESWAGIMRYFDTIPPASGLDIRTRSTRGILHIDLGLMSEDVNGDGAFQSEDSNFDRTVSEEEDVGLDLIPDELEVDRFGNPYHPADNPDPAGDNWWFPRDDDVSDAPVPDSIKNSSWFRSSILDETGLWRYMWLNGTENNRSDPLALAVPDRENLGGSSLEIRNAYFSFRLDVSSDFFLLPGSEFNGWRTFRIPILDTLAIDTIVTFSIEDPHGADSITVYPDWSIIKYARVWFESAENMNDTVIVEIADWRFVEP
jgi:hypothetical protein